MTLNARPYNSSAKGYSLHKSTLIIPSISLGNVPQLAIDLLIQNFDFIKVGSLDSLYLYPFASPIDTSSTSQGHIHTEGISSALDVYYSESHKVTIIQQRSPIIPTFCKNHVSEIISPFISQFSFENIIILDSSDAGLVEQFAPGTIQVYTNEDLLNRSLESLNILKRDTIQLSSNIPYGHSLYARNLIQGIDDINNGSEIKLDLNVLVTFVYEGDNFYDAKILANKLVSIIKLESVKSWSKPISWLGAYGDKPVPNAMEEGLFG